MKSKVKGVLMQLPALIILIIITLGAFYIKLSKMPIQGQVISWATPITILIIVALYFWGRKVENRAPRDIF